MYEELTNRLRKRGERINKFGSPFFTEANANDMIAAADAIEELSKRLDESIPKGDAEIIISEVAKPRWIPVTEQLPGCKCHVLVTDGKFVGEAAFFPEAIWHSNYFPPTFSDPVEEYEDYRGVTHWQPLPKPPKEETE